MPSCAASRSNGACSGPTRSPSRRAARGDRRCGRPAAARRVRPDTRAIHPQQHVWRLRRRPGARGHDPRPARDAGRRARALWRRLFELRQPPGETSVWRVWTDDGPVERFVDWVVAEVPVLAGASRSPFHAEAIAPEGEGEPSADGPRPTCRWWRSRSGRRGRRSTGCRSSTTAARSSCATAPPRIRGGCRPRGCGRSGLRCAGSIGARCHSASSYRTEARVSLALPTAHPGSDLQVGHPRLRRRWLNGSEYR